MLITITVTGESAADLGFLLHKHPARLQSFPVSVGTAHAFYPENTAEACTAALLLEVDPIALVRGRRGPAGDGFALGQYVNDRPYAASSMLSMALAKVFRTAMTGRCDARPERAASAIPLQIHLPALPCRDGGDLVRRVFEPLGWRVVTKTTVLDERFPSWGDSRYLDVRLAGEMRLADALNHVYVLLPVLDDAKHYWVSPDEVDKLIRAGGGWLADHPEKALISSRYLARRRVLTEAALARLAEVDDLDAGSVDNADEVATVGAEPDRPVTLAEQRRSAVLAALRGTGARRVGDFGCGEGNLVAALLADRTIEQVVAVDVSPRSLATAARRLRLDQLPDRERARLLLFQSSLTYRDDRLRGLDAGVLMEVIEHVDPPRLEALERNVFGHAAPTVVIVTTPNVEYNVRFGTLAPEEYRHRDHRFEWTRSEFRRWSHRVAVDHGYAVVFLPVGPDDPEVGPPTQLALFEKGAAA